MNYVHFTLKIRDNRRKQKILLYNIIVNILWISMDMFKILIENSILKIAVFKSGCLLHVK